MTEHFRSSFRDLSVSDLVSETRTSLPATTLSAGQWGKSMSIFNGTNERLAAALDYRRRGWSVIPIRERDKKPVSGFDWKEFQSRIASEGEIRGWWERWPEANVAIVTGPISGIVVVDIDGPEGETALGESCGELPATVTSHTAKGRHLLLLHPGVPVKSRNVLHKVDVRGDGGYIVAPPSEHESGAFYSWSTEPGRDFSVQPARVSPALLELLTDAPAFAETRNNATVGPGRKLSPRVTKAEMELPVPEGRRNETLARFAGSLYADGQDKEAVLDALLTINATRCQPPLSERAVETIVDSIGRRDERAGRATRRQPTLVTRQLDTVIAEEMEWLWEKRVPLGGLTICEGPPGVGKSLFTLDIAARVSTGRDMPDGTPGLLGRVLLLNIEDNVARTIVPRLEAAGADQSQIRIIDYVDLGDGRRRPACLPDDLELIRENVVKLGVRLIIVDPLMAFLSTKVNSWSDQQVRTALSPLGKLAEELDVAVLVVRHLTKNRDAGPLEAGSGSVGIIASARSAFVLARAPDDDDQVVMAPLKQNLSARVDSLAFRLESNACGAPRVVWLGVSNWDAAGLRPLPQHSGKLDEAREFLATFLAQSARTEKETSTAAGRQGISKTTLKRAKSQLGITATKVGFGKDGQWWWSLGGDDEGQHPSNPTGVSPLEPGASGYHLGGAGHEKTKEIISSIPISSNGTDHDSS